MANEVEIRVTADTKRAERGLSGLRGSLDKFSRQARIAGAALTGIGIVGVAGLKKLIDASKEEEIGILKLNQALINVGETYGSNKIAIEEVIASIQKKTNFGDEAQRESLRTLITIGGQYEGSLVALKVATDMAAGANMSLEGASLLLGKAIAGETSALSRYGIKLEEGATQTEIMAALTKQFGGIAEAAADPMTQLGNRIGDVGQQIGRNLNPFVDRAVELIEGLAFKLTEADPALVRTISLSVALGVGFALIGGPLLLMIGLLPFIIKGFGTLGVLALPFSKALLAIAAAVAIGVVAWRKWDFITTAVAETGHQMSDTFDTWGIAIQNFVNTLITGINGLIDIAQRLSALSPGGGIFAGITKLDYVRFDRVSRFIKDEIGSIADEAKLGWAITSQDIEKLFDSLKGEVGATFDDIGGIFDDLMNNMGFSLEDFETKMDGMAKSLIETLGEDGNVPTALETTADGLKNIGNNATAAKEKILELNAATTSQITPVGGGAGGGMPGVFLTGGGQGAFSGIPGINDPALWTSLLQGFLTGNPTPNQTEKALFMRRHAAFGAPPTFVKDTLSSQPFIDQFLKVRGFAHGGIVTRPTLAMIGEAGPEAVVPLGGGRGMAPTYNISISGNTVFGEMDFKRLVVDAVTDSHRRGGLPFLGRA